MRDKPAIRLPEDDEWDGGNPYAEGATRPPMRDFQIAGRGWQWWTGIIGAGLAWFFTHQLLG
jgi:hypothetical protein